MECCARAVDQCDTPDQCLAQRGLLVRPFSADSREEKSSKLPGVIVVQEWWGLSDQIKGLCDRFAVAGFDALAPDGRHAYAD